MSEPSPFAFVERRTLYVSRRGKEKEKDSLLSLAPGGRLTAHGLPLLLSWNARRFIDFLLVEEQADRKFLLLLRGAG